MGDVARLVADWKFFLGACFLTGALLLPYAKPGPVMAGMVLAGLIRFAWAKITGGRDPAP